MSHSVVAALFQTKGIISAIDYENNDYLYGRYDK